MPASIGTVFSGENILSSTALQINSGAIPAGRRLILASAAGISGTNAYGLSNLTADTNTITRDRAVAQRASTIGVSISDSVMSDALEAANPVDYTFANAWSRKLGMGVAVDGLSGAVDGASAGVVDLGNVSVGSNGSGTSISGAGSITTTHADCLLIAAVGFSASGNSLTPSGGWSLLDGIGSSAGTTFRSLAICYRVVSAIGTYTFSGTLAATSGWAVATAAYEIAAGGPPPAIGGGVIEAGVKNPFVDSGVIVGGVKFSLVDLGRLTGGVKEPFV